MKILVTGGAGFIGSHLCERLLDEGHDVICYDNLFTGSKKNFQGHSLVPGDRMGDLKTWDHPRFEFIRGDVVDRFHAEVDQVYHLACPASPVHYQQNPVQTIKTAVMGTLNVLEMARDVIARVLIASTSEVYGDPQEHPQKETYWGNVNPIGSRSCYDEGKRCAESLATSYSSQYGVEVRIARIFNTYGPRMQRNDGRVVSNFICQALAGKDITIYGDGTQTRSFCFVTDTVDGLVKLMNSDVETPVNIGNPEELTIGHLAHNIKLKCERFCAESKVVRKPLPQDDPTRRKPDISIAQRLLKWKPTVPVSEGLNRTIGYFVDTYGFHLRQP
ncbi:WcaG Nucleoside-diphosphate-sugar epimerases [uncultured Caudovirales phage]|uniref:WcaG Nucleoside-diphosphate-sugar epimerases n=1 Tax=uncultured Caudovirales phage TaxID=2100421 RepID=A0A6J5LIM9_9CAUD|nr:WcaG Nucleoside-diphosphate-sugar epimerases [uncultured Caudovirales phage]CAB4135268.1 WcaG Nucleoside-diphosphate-sugar epimerases [uncultured Caudovirales phage]